MMLDKNYVKCKQRGVAKDTNSEITKKEVRRQSFHKFLSLFIFYIIYFIFIPVIISLSSVYCYTFAKTPDVLKVSSDILPLQWTTGELTGLSFRTNIERILDIGERDGET